MKSDLRQLLDELHAAIERTRESDEDRAELTRLVEAVERRLHEDGDDRPGHLLASLRQAEVRFESDHPVLGAAIRRAIDALSAAGI